MIPEDQKYPRPHLPRRNPFADPGFKHLTREQQITVLQRLEISPDQLKVILSDMRQHESLVMGENKLRDDDQLPLPTEVCKELDRFLRG